MSGAKRVERVSIETSKATSPPERKAMTLDEVPLGQEPTRITPAAVEPFRWENHTKQPSQTRHDDIVGYSPENNWNWTLSNTFKIFSCQGKPHTKENQTKQISRIGNDPTTSCRKGVVKGRPEDNSYSKPFAEPFTKRYK